MTNALKIALISLLTFAMLSSSGCAALHAVGTAVGIVKGASSTKSGGTDVTAHTQLGGTQDNSIKATAKQTTQTTAKGDQAANDLITLKAEVASMIQGQQINAKDVDRIVTNNRIGKLVWFIIGLLISTNLLFIFMWGQARNQNRPIDSLQKDKEWNEEYNKLFND